MAIRLIEVGVPLLEPFTTAAGTVDKRRSVLVGVGEGAVTGWGEAAPFPGQTPDTIDGVWSSLAAGDAAPTPSARAAREEAESDLRARLADQPLWAALGGSRRQLPTSLSIGLGEDPLERLAATGAAAVKLKIQPGRDVSRVGIVRDVYPDLVIGVDANGSYSWGDRDALIELDRFDTAYIEQPFAPDDLASHAELRRELLAAVVIDEPIDSVDAAVRVVEADAADILTLKPGRIGLDACRAIHDLALTAGLRVKASGLVETAVGRAHTLAVATLPASVHSDLAADTWFFDPVTGTPAAVVREGWITAPDGPGIGVEPDLGGLAPYIVRETVLA